MANADIEDNGRDPDRLYKLLPALYRERDEEEGYPLRSLLRIIADQENILREDIQHLWDNFFIETCDPWVIPYIGDLIGNNLLHGLERNNSKDTAKELFPDLAGRNLFPEAAVRTRADVAKTIYYRRRKGTIQILEEMARDVTGWADHAVEFFELLEWTQNLNHLRPNCFECADLRLTDKIALKDGPFDTLSHSADVRAIKQTEGWYNVPNIGIFLWRLKSYPLSNVMARKGKENWQYYFSPLGNPAPLFMRLRREGDESGLATELHVPGTIRRSLFAEELDRYFHELKSEYFPRIYRPFYELPGKSWIPSGESSIFIMRNDQPVLPVDTSDPKNPKQVLFSCDLGSWPQPEDNHVFVDVEMGRIALGKDLVKAEDPTESLEVSFCYGFGADLGGGSYNREKWLVKAENASLHINVERKGLSLIDAIKKWKNENRPNAIIHILDSSTYLLPDVISLRNEGWVVIEAANEERPLLQTSSIYAGLEIRVDEPLVKGNPNRESSLTFSGLVLEGFIHITGDLGKLRVIHSTLIPGRRLKEDGDHETQEPSLIVDGSIDIDSNKKELINAKLQVQIACSITGPLYIPPHAAGLWILDSIIDGIVSENPENIAIAASGPIAEFVDDNSDANYGPPATLERVTIFGKSYFDKLLLASEVIFTAAVEVKQRQEGCIRFSFVAEDSKMPRPYRCQPQLEIARQMDAAEKKANRKLSINEKKKIEDSVRGWLVPAFKTVRYGLPYYSQLSLRAPIEIRTGAEDGSEMGAFCLLKQNQREKNLQIRLEEYLPFGLEYGIIYVT